MYLRGIYFSKYYGQGGGEMVPGKKMKTETEGKRGNEKKGKKGKEKEEKEKREDDFFV